MAIVALCCASPSLARLPEPVRAMIDAAIASGDPKTVRIVTDVARQANPSDAAEIDAMLAQYRAELADAKANEEAQAQEQRRNAGLLDGWSGEGELGAFSSSGNARNTGLTVAAELIREGVYWSHTFRGRADYQETDGVTTREQFLAAYEPKYQFSDNMYAFALALYERDRFQGFSGRYALAGGIGYDAIDNESATLTVQAGPAYRRTELVDGSQTQTFAGNASLDLDWRIASAITLTQDASAFVQSGSSTFISGTGVQIDIADELALRLSYTLEHDTDPPLGALKTDTLSRITIIYDF